MAAGGLRRNTIPPAIASSGSLQSRFVVLRAIRRVGRDPSITDRQPCELPEVPAAQRSCCQSTEPFQVSFRYRPRNYPAAIQNQERPPPGSWLSRQSIPAMRPTLNSQQRFFVCDGLGRMRLTDASETRVFGERSRCRRVRGNGGPDGSRGGPGPDQGRGGRFLFCQTGSRGRAETMGDANGARFLCVQLCERLFEDFLGRRLTDRRIILWQRFDHFAGGLKFLKNGFNRRSFLHLFPLLRDPEERWSTGTSRRGTKSSWREE